MTHDCINCPEQDKCAIEHIAPWLDEHEDEILRAKESVTDNLALAISTLVGCFPLVLVIQEELAGFAKQAFLLGYHKGRQFPSIPQVYQE